MPGRFLHVLELGAVLQRGGDEGRAHRAGRVAAEEVTKAIIATANCAETAVSVGIEDVASDDWTETVYKPDIIGKPDTIYKKPGYNPL